MGCTEKCYSHDCCTTFEVKRKTKSACVSKTSMPNFNSGPRRKKPRRLNADNSRFVVPPGKTRKRPVLKARKNQRLGQVISGAPFLVSYLDTKNYRTVPKANMPLLSCKRLRSTCRNLQDVSTQTVNVSSAKSIYTGSKPNCILGTENSLLQDWLKMTSPLKVKLKNDGLHCSSRVGSQQRGSGDTGIGRCKSVDMNNLDVCCFPLINIRPHTLRNESSGSKFDERSVGIAEVRSEKCDRMENEDSLIGYIYQAQDKVNDIRTRLVKLRYSLTSRTTTPRDTKQAKQLKKALDSIIKEVDAVSEMGRNLSTLSDASPCHSPVTAHSSKGGHSPNITRYNDCAGDIAYKLHHTKTKFKSKNYSETPEIMPGSPECTPTHKAQPKQHRKDHLPRSPSIKSVSSSVGKESSLTLLKKELGHFFEKMKVETDLLMEDAQIHHEALLNYSGPNSISSSEISSTDSVGL